MKSGNPVAPLGNTWRLAAAATKKYRARYEFADMAKAEGLVSILIGHVTKKGQIAGPKDLEQR
jgi:predicted ATP-dependent serine protease